MKKKLLTVLLLGLVLSSCRTSKKNVEVNYTDLPYGFAKYNESDYSFQDKFTLYLPHRKRSKIRKRSKMSDEVNQWINIRGGDKNIDNYESRFFILVNNSTIDTFLEKID